MHLLLILQHVNILKLGLNNDLSLLFDWLQAFAVYVSVIVRNRPQRALDLMSYQILLLEGINEYQNNRPWWLAYDQ